MENINRLCILNTDRFDDPAVFAMAYCQMDSGRKKKIDAFKAPRSKKQSLGAGLLLKNALSEIGITDYQIELGDREKPYLAGHPDVFFNLSHSGNRVALGISDREIGVDIEADRCFEDSLINYVFTEGDKALAKELQHEPGISLDQIYTLLWTAKESIMKYSGLGIGLEPQKLELFLKEGLSEGIPPLAVRSEAFDFSALSLISYEIPGYQLTVCSEYQNFLLEELLPSGKFSIKA